MSLSHPNQTMSDALTAQCLSPKVETDLYNFTSLSVSVSAFSHIEVLYQGGYYQVVFAEWDFGGQIERSDLILEQGVGAGNVAKFISLWIAHRAANQDFYSAMDEGDNGGARAFRDERDKLVGRVEAARQDAEA